MDLDEFKRLYEKTKPKFNFSKAKKAIRTQERKAKKAIAKDEQARALTGGSQKILRCLQCTRPIRSGVCLYCSDSPDIRREKRSLLREVESKIRSEQESQTLSRLREVESKIRFRQESQTLSSRSSSYHEDNRSSATKRKRSESIESSGSSSSDDSRKRRKKKHKNKEKKSKKKSKSKKKKKKHKNKHR